MSILKPISKDADKRLTSAQLQKNDNTVHYVSKYVTLVEDNYGMLFDNDNQPSFVKRFTWTNHNKISVAVITYGARIVSMKLPDRGGNVEEIVLGFDDLAGYIFYEKYDFGATIGRTTTKLNKSTYVVDGKQYWLTANDNEHHIRGGERGFDKVNWVPYVNGKTLQLSYLSPDGEEGYPGDLHVRMTFELTTSAEFRIAINANTTKATPVDISNLTYVNLAGHQAGEEEIKKHELLINAGCYTQTDDKNEFPTGKILKVIHTRNNFQTPVLLEKVMTEGKEATFDQYLCINRGVDQGDAFVARLIHPYKGRVLEIYSNQQGLNFNNGAEFPTGRLNIPTNVLPILRPSQSDTDLTEENESLFVVIGKLAQYFRDVMNLPQEEYQGFLRNLMKKFLDSNQSTSTDSMTSFSSQLELIETVSKYATTIDADLTMILKPLEVQFLKAFKELLPYVTEDIPVNLIKEAIDEILVMHMNDGSTSESNSFINQVFMNQMHLMNSIYEEEEEAGEDGESFYPRTSVFRHMKEKRKSIVKNQLQRGVPMPDFYKHEKIVGRGGVVYRKYGGIALQTQGYPNALQNPNFPSSILKPTETYNHTITYKFWILANNPAKWLRRVEVGPCVDVSSLSSHVSSNISC